MLESVYVRNELFACNEEGTAILSRDGSELISVLENHNNVIIAASVEFIKEGAVFPSGVVDFASGSRLRSIDFETFVEKPKSLIITMDNGVVTS